MENLQWINTNVPISIHFILLNSKSKKSPILKQLVSYGLFYSIKYKLYKTKKKAGFFYSNFHLLSYQ